MSRRFLSRKEVQTFYDQFGRKQDWQKFYEGTAIRELLENGGFETSLATFEFGCGTGAFAETLLSQYLPEKASYLGIDLSTVMVNLAQTRLSSFEGRARVEQGDTPLHFGLKPQSIDHFVSNYVLDLLSPDNIKTVLDDAHRLLKQDGRLCLLSLTHGQTFFSGILTRTWDRIHRIQPGLVGGCRPVNLLDYLPEKQWRVDHHHIITAFGIPSQMVIASKSD